MRMMAVGSSFRIALQASDFSPERIIERVVQYAIYSAKRGLSRLNKILTILTDVHFLVPCCVLVAGIALLIALH